MAEMKITHEKLTSKTTSRRKRNDFSKSLSDLEYEEFKRFMDFCFLFFEEDKNSNLAFIIHGLQRLGKNDDKIHENSDSKLDEILVDESGFTSFILRLY